MFIDVTILLTCLNFDIDIESTTIYIKLLKYQYIFGILHIIMPTWSIFAGPVTLRATTLV